MRLYPIESSWWEHSFDSKLTLNGFLHLILWALEIYGDMCGLVGCVLAPPTPSTQINITCTTKTSAVRHATEGPNPGKTHSEHPKHIKSAQKHKKSAQARRFCFYLFIYFWSATRSVTRLTRPAGRLAGRTRFSRRYSNGQPSVAINRKSYPNYKFFLQWQFKPLQSPFWCKLITFLYVQYHSIPCSFVVYTGDAILYISSI